MLNDQNFSRVLTLAGSPNDVRGFEEFKLNSGRKFLDELETISQNLHP